MALSRKLLRRPTSLCSLPPRITPASQPCVSLARHVFLSRRGHSTIQPDEAGEPPLKGVRILDFTRILAAPFCTQILADYGADVIKVEQPGKGDETRAWKGKDEAAAWKPDVGPMSFFFAALNRNKRSLTLDLKKAAGVEVVKRLVREGGVDVVIENFIPGGADRLGIGYEALRDINPRLVYVSLSGYGSSGPYAGRAGYDAIANAEGGLMHITGHPDAGPVRAGVGLTDMATGLFAHGAIVTALWNREKTGRGQFISASLFETTISLLTSVGAEWLNMARDGRRFGAGHPSAVPYNAWECRDGVHLVVAANSDRQFHALCDRLGRAELKTDERFVTNALRVENRHAIDAILADAFAARTSAEWLEVLDGSGLAHGPVNTIQKAFEHPQIEAREMVRDVAWDALRSGRWRAIGVPVKFSATPGSVRDVPPRLGEHTDRVLVELGYSLDQVEEMRKEGVV